LLPAPADERDHRPELEHDDEGEERQLEPEEPRVEIERRALLETPERAQQACDDPEQSRQTLSAANRRPSPAASSGALSARPRQKIAGNPMASASTCRAETIAERWSKLSVNCMANGLAGLSGLGSAEVRTRDGVRRVAIHLAAETIKVGRARGHEVEPIWGITAQRFVDAAEGQAMADVERDMAERAKELAGGRPSLLQDVMRGRRTEVQYLNGYVSEQGRQVGVATPFNDKVVELITRVPPGTLKPDLKNLEPLVAMLPK
jgi:hypothetical protein